MAKLDVVIPAIFAALYLASLGTSAALINADAYTITYLLFDAVMGVFLGFMWRGGR